MTATLNVNLATCACHRRDSWQDNHIHRPACGGEPITIPCPIPPTFEVVVRLGECRGFSSSTKRGCSGSWTTPSPSGPVRHEHELDCHARPIRVSCSISGKTWAESEVADPEGVGEDGRLVGFTFASPVHAVCFARWALVKALVTGKFAHRDVGDAGPGTPEALFKQRDSVFDALADMVMAEQLALDAQTRFAALESIARVASRHGLHPEERPSAAMLAEYVAHLIEQVGAIS